METINFEKSQLSGSEGETREQILLQRHLQRLGFSNVDEYWESEAKKTEKILKKCKKRIVCVVDIDIRLSSKENDVKSVKAIVFGKNFDEIYKKIGGLESSASYIVIGEDVVIL